LLDDAREENARTKTCDQKELGNMFARLAPYVVLVFASLGMSLYFYFTADGYTFEAITELLSLRFKAVSL